MGGAINHTTPATMDDWMRNVERRLLTQERRSPKNEIGGGATPVGGILAFGGSEAPVGWLLADGSAVSRSIYNDLYKTYGTTYGIGDGTSTFNLPNLKGKVIVGVDAGQAEFNLLGETGGEKTHTLTATEMPAHNHTFTRDIGFSQGNGIYHGSEWLSDTGRDDTVITSTAGSGGAHNNLQPYTALNYIIKT